MEAARLLDAVDAVDRVERRDARGGSCGPSGSIDSRPASSRASISSAAIRRPPIATSTAGDVADQAARREADEHLLDIGAGDPLGLLDRLADRDLALLHVGDEAALDAAALALAGAEDAQLAVLVRLGDQRADLGRADVERGDQVADRDAWAARRPIKSSLDRSCGGWPGSARSAAAARSRRARARCGHRCGAGRACRSGRSRGRASGSCWSIMREAGERRRASSSPSGSVSVSPLWKRMSQRRWPTQVAPAICGLQRAAPPASRAPSAPIWRLASGPITSGRSGIASTPHRLQHDAVGVDQAQLPVVLPDRGRLALDDVDDQRVGQPARHPRLADPAEAEQPRARRRRDRPAASPSNRWSKATL